MGRFAMALLGIAIAAPRAHADPTLRRRDASLAELMRGPYRSSRLFAMPVADVVGAYQLSISGDGSLLQETGVLSFAGVLALGFGDLIQLEYRHTAAISVDNTSAPLPAIGVQLELPIPERKYVPAFAVALRIGVPRDEDFAPTTVKESVTDLYVVGRLALWGFAEGASVHGGVRVSKAAIEVDVDDDGAPEHEVDRYIVLPALGLDVVATRTAHLVVEAGLAPQFRYDRMAPAAPTIGPGLLGRLGVRWFVHPAFSIDASLGYQLEVAGARVADGLTDVVQWDIRLGAELFVPWGALACKGMGWFCQQGGAP